METDEDRVRAWLKVPQKRGRPSCPCGFIGHTRTIINHRLACDSWKTYVRMAVGRKLDQ